MKIALISCSAKKRSCPSKAKDLYDSPLFKMSFAYAKKIGADKIFILSAKYGLLESEEIVEPYNQTLNRMNSKEKEDWGKIVLSKLALLTKLAEDDFIFLAGENYRKNLVPKIKNFTVPMKGLGIGKQLRWLKMRI